MQVKPLKTIHLSRVIEIEHACFDKAVWESASIYEERLNSFPNGNLGIFSGDDLAGFLWCERWNYEEQYGPDRFKLSHSPKAYHDPQGKELYISSFAVDPKFRKHIRGKTAFAKLIEHTIVAHDITSSILLVSEQWKAARAIYTQWGFEEIQRIQDFFTTSDGNQWDGLIMRTLIHQQNLSQNHI
jgi:ribosomal-protein-alanine N-acetyltransferase